MDASSPRKAAPRSRIPTAFNEPRQARHEMARGDESTSREVPDELPPLSYEKLLSEVKSLKLLAEEAGRNAEKEATRADEEAKKATALEIKYDRAVAEIDRRGKKIAELEARLGIEPDWKREAEENRRPTGKPAGAPNTAATPEACTVPDLGRFNVHKRNLTEPTELLVAAHQAHAKTPDTHPSFTTPTSAATTRPQDAPGTFVRPTIAASSNATAGAQTNSQVSPTPIHVGRARGSRHSLPVGQPSRRPPTPRSVPPELRQHAEYFARKALDEADLKSQAADRRQTPARTPLLKLIARMEDELSLEARCKHNKHLDDESLFVVSDDKATWADVAGKTDGAKRLTCRRCVEHYYFCSGEQTCSRCWYDREDCMYTVCSTDKPKDGCEAKRCHKWHDQYGLEGLRAYMKV
ncbi:hypothetical protein K490DRAFT_57757 [Saccharata proteae CBS 121410]|uniref:Uncharacterized protein n=1 Tax=Saccharata proteae CBS 121410 TaxID=1314787 RepID=A0A9P4LVX8_9PEZI|nr:hypothetical protein K490DRAFT_57757 [Saccharata proteae CBS 121410]